MRQTGIACAWAKRIHQRHDMPVICTQFSDEMVPAASCGASEGDVIVVHRSGCRGAPGGARAIRCWGGCWRARALLAGRLRNDRAAHARGKRARSGWFHAVLHGDAAAAVDPLDALTQDAVLIRL